MSDPRTHFHETASKDASAAIHTSSTHHAVSHRPVKSSDGRITNLKSSQHYVQSTSDASLVIRPQTSTSTSLIIPQEISFEMYGHAHIYKNLCFEFTLANIGAGVINPGYIGSLINRLEFINASGELIEQITGDQFYLDLLALTDEQYSAARGYMGLTADFSVDTTAANQIAVGASRQYYLPIYAWVNQFLPCIQLIRDKIYMRVYLAAISPVTGASSDFSLTNFEINVSGFRVSMADYSHLEKEYKMGVSARYPYRVLQERVVSLAPSTTYKEKLTAFTHLVSHFIFCLRADPITASARFTFQAVDSFALEESDGTVYDITRQADFEKAIRTPKLFSSSLFASKNLYLFNFAERPELFFKEGMVSGYKRMSTNEVLSFSTPSTLVAGNFRISIWGYTHSLVSVKDGKITVARSG